MRGSTVPARAAVVAAIYAIASLAAALARNRSLRTSLAVAIVGWGAAFVGWWFVLAMREG